MVTEKTKLTVVVLFSVGVVVVLWMSSRVASDAVARWVPLSIAVVANLLGWVIWLVEKKRKRGSGSFWG